MSDNPSGVPAATDNPMVVQQPPTSVTSIEGVDVTAVGGTLRDVVNLGLGIDVVNLGLLYGVLTEPDGTVVLGMTLTTTMCSLTDVIEEQAQQILSLIADRVRVQWAWLSPWGSDKITSKDREQLRTLGFNVWIPFEAAVRSGPPRRQRPSRAGHARGSGCGHGRQAGVSRAS